MAGAALAFGAEMEATLITVTMKAKADLIPWEKEYEKFVSFSSKEDAVFFWCLRDNLVPQFTEEVCVLSENPFTHHFYIVGLSLTVPAVGDLPKAKQEAEMWKHAWCEGRLKYGKEVWKAYYQGVRDEQNGSVYDKEFGQKYFPEIK